MLTLSALPDANILSISARASRRREINVTCIETQVCRAASTLK